MKILLVGNFSYPIYEPAFGAALRDLGHEVVDFSFGEYFKNTVGLLQLRFPTVHPAGVKANRAMLEEIKNGQPDVLLIWRPTHVYPRTLQAAKKVCPAIIIVSYNNDDPFGPEAHGVVPWHHHFLWRLYLRTLPLVDLALVFRPVNVAEARSKGAPRSAVLMPYFLPERDRPLALSETEQSKYECDVVFAGHYEPDGREKYLEELMKAGLHVRLYGGRYWNGRVFSEIGQQLLPVREVIGEEYVKALSGAKLCLCFLSRRNRDVYTRRCFEIPASGGVLFSERTEALQRLFVEDEEVVFFSSTAECVEKARWLIAHPVERSRIAAAGYRRVHADGHSVLGRAKEFVGMVDAVRSGNWVVGNGYV